ncbi:MAG: hypothetical protein PHG25_03000 [Candidatus Pacebacteria bacterium]|nr:hypothetical protein [Candidatus Paceibacterota bacterium]
MTQQIPEELKKLAQDPKIYDAIEKIGGDFDLHIDQMGELDAEVRRIMLGLSNSKDFTKNISTLLEIDSVKSTKIAERINADLFQTIKSGLQSQSIPKIDTGSTTRSSFEAAGNFTVEPEQGSNNIDQSAHPLESHADLIAGIENPTPAQPRSNSTSENHVETMLVDHLLAGPIVSIEKKTEIDQEPPVPHKPVAVAPKKPSGPDLYREQF